MEESRTTKREVIKFLRARGCNVSHDPLQRDFTAVTKELGVTDSTAREMWATRMELDRPPLTSDNDYHGPIAGKLWDVLDAAEWSIRLSIPMLEPDIASALWRASMRGLSVRVLLGCRPSNTWQTDMIKYSLEHDVALHVSKKDDSLLDSYAVIDSKMVAKLGENSFGKRGLREFEPAKEAP